jgi:sulfite reductase (ferredoxin)
VNPPDAAVHTGRSPEHLDGPSIVPATPVAVAFFEPRRGQGQWAAGQREPLNADERLSRPDDGLRVWLDGEQLTTAQLRTVGEVSRRYAQNSADIIGPQSIQLHWVRIEDAPEIFARFEAAGLTASRAGGDTPRTLLGSPVAGIAADEIVDGTPALREIRDRAICREEFPGLPRTFRTAISGSPRLDVFHEVNDVSFVGVRHPELGPGFDVWVGGGLAASPVLAGRLGTFVTVAEVPEVWAAIVGAFRDYGYQRPRGHARLGYLIADWGTGRFRHTIETEYLHRRLADGPAPPAPAGPRDHIGVHAQRDGRCYVGITPMASRVSGTILLALADIAEAHGSVRLCTTPYQKIVILDIPPDRVESLCDSLGCIGLTARPILFWRTLARDRPEAPPRRPQERN